MNASVIVCSRNRADSLLETLDSLIAMTVPPSLSWELIVVDNASTDGTAQRVRAWASKAPRPVLLLEEARPGKSHALNLAVSQSTGTLLAFTDDDALVDPDWLATAMRCVDEHDADCVGGRVVPHWLSPRPPWLSDRLINVLAMLDLGPKPKQIRAGEPGSLYGVNYIFRRKVLDRLGGFETTNYTRGIGLEDYDMVNRVQLSGGRVFYDPKMVVRHKVFPERATRAYFRRWHHHTGRDRAEWIVPGGQRILGLEGYMLRNFGRTATRLIGAAVRANRDEFFYQELVCRLYLSYVRRRLNQFRSRSVPSPRSALLARVDPPEL